MFCAIITFSDFCSTFITRKISSLVGERREETISFAELERVFGGDIVTLEVFNFANINGNQDISSKSNDEIIFTKLGIAPGMKRTQPDTKLCSNI